MKYCALQERSHVEVQDKLKSWGVLWEHRNDLISFLIENNFLNEERFARAYARGKFRIKNWGRKKIEKGLKAKGVFGYNLKAAFEEINAEDYAKTLSSLAEKKYKTLRTGSQFEKKIKLRAYLLGKGFEHNLVSEIIKQYD